MASHLTSTLIADARQVGKAIFKFISRNDVGVTGGHQYGFLLPKPHWKLFTDMPPEEGKLTKKNVAVVWHDGYETDSVVTWYSSKSEYRLTSFGLNFPHLSPENAGDLLAIVPHSHTLFHAYIISGDEEIEELFAELDVNIFRTVATYVADALPATISEDDCLDQKFEFFAQGLVDFPPTLAFSNAAFQALIDCRSGFTKEDNDKRLERLVNAEYALFRTVERKVYKDQITGPFASVDAFLDLAQSVLQRRKSRAGSSLQHHVARILKENGISYASQATTELNKKPDFLFPNQAAYSDPSFADDQLRMLAVKTTCKDRWRQVPDEANRIKQKHLLTLQADFSPNQLSQIKASGLTLVLPKEVIRKKYQNDESAPITTLDQFIEELKVIQRSAIG